MAGDSQPKETQVKPEPMSEDDEDEQENGDEETASMNGSPSRTNRKKNVIADSDDEGEEKEEAGATADVNFDGISPEELFGRLDHDKVGRLQLVKKYHADARTFIRLLEDGFKEKDSASEDETPGALPKIIELLNSTIKSEVLEAIDFLSVASQYKMTGAEAGIKAMLHLIWAKDNSTLEDGKEVKGVRSKLIECYKTLYFDPLPDLQPKENVSRIARHMVE